MAIVLEYSAQANEGNFVSNNKVLSVTIPSGLTNAVLVISKTIARDSFTQLTGITVNGSATGIVERVTNLVAAGRACRMWTLNAPTPGTYNIVLTFTTSSENGGRLTAMVFSGVDQTTPVSATNSGSTGSAATPYSTTITTPSGGVAVATIRALSATAMTPSGSQTLVGTATGEDAVSYLADATAMAHAWTGTSPTQVSQVVLSLTPGASVDTTPPTITSASSFSVAENTSTVATLTANETVTWAKTGGADQALFTLNSSTGALSFTAAPDFEAPADADTNNVYVLQVTATDTSANASTPQNINVTVTDVADTPGVLDTAAVKLGSWVGSGASLTFAHDVGVSYRAEVYASGLVLGNAILTLAARNTGSGGVYGADISSLSLAVGTEYEVVFTNQATGQKSAPYKLAAHA